MTKFLRSGVGIGTLFLGAIFSSCQMYPSNSESAHALAISMDNLVEIKEEVQLDSYGYNRMNAEIQEGKVKRNESLYLILRDMDVSPQVIYEIDKKSKGIFQSNHIKPGQRYIAYKKKESDKPYRLILHTNALEYVVFDWKSEVNVTTGQKEVTTKIASAKGEIQSSLYETLVEKGQSILLGYHLSDIFAWQIDFFRLYPGDEFKVIYEEEFVDGKSFGIGKVLAAEFTSKNETFDAFYYESDNFTGYYDSEGDGVQKALMKAPFKYSHRVSSNFSHSRYHPVLKRRTPHYGVDYAAPIGTPVLSVGDGEVVEARYRGANGNIVKIRHNGTYTTAYLHLNGFAKGIRTGINVKQGQVIGYVGKTGRVTGVHLDYRVYKHGQPVNPLKIDLPPSKSISPDEMDRFSNQIKKLKAELSQVTNGAETESAVATASLIN